jgi:hypothetical protein
MLKALPFHAGFYSLAIPSISVLRFNYKLCTFLNKQPVSMAERSEACTVFGRSNIGIAFSNPVRDMDVCPRFFCVVLSCVGRGLASG